MRQFDQVLPQGHSRARTPLTACCSRSAPRAEISSVEDETIRSSVLDVDPAVFRRLQPGDILFFDGSHITFNGTDVVYFFLEVLPTLPAGDRHRPHP